MNSDLKADEILAMRQRLEKTQEQMAVMLGVSTRNYQRWEKGDHPMPYATARLLTLIMEEE